ncbi:hypothetical protein [Sabulicella glaciei]|uniref:Uncharacterized protein n=1 Tax=Sabulicella glaciei TaxID=2984948 RepID=A0ABT3NT48_9PROT|nr:hypothetical protein [Roseococcus sp. MDT2-1-1]MCW8084729.1 hypothetical protein [Roseococcus sp. MDT2-1-1]
MPDNQSYSSEGRVLAPLPDFIVPVPREVSRRAWDCAFDLGAEHSGRIGSEALWHAFQAIVTGRDPELLTWAECSLLLRAHRHLRGTRA